MRNLASYSFEADVGADAADTLAVQVEGCIERWLLAKGSAQGQTGQFALRDGRVAELTRSRTTTAKGAVSEFSVIEPAGGGMFQTSLSVAHEPDRLAFFCELSAGSPQLMPLWVDVHSPRVIRDILALPLQWSYGETKLRAQPQNFRGNTGGNEFIDFVWDERRSIPVIAVSDEYGLLLHPGITTALASDVAGLAIVAQLDPDAAWRLTARKGKNWSCYGGAIRLYWPGIRDDAEPQQHPLWTAQRLLFGMADTESAAGRIRSQLRQKILGQSAFAVTAPALFAAIRRASREEDLAGLLSRIEQGDNYKVLAEEFFGKLAELNESLSSREEEIAHLKSQIANLQLALRWRDEGPESVAPSEEAPPTTAQDAVLTAMENHPSDLLFGSDIDAGLGTIAADAGPPDKILSYLKALAEMAEARRKGPLGTNMIRWLADRGISASGESETIRNSTAETRARTWDDGKGVRRSFELHMKPAEGTSPDRCVRIYFDYDEEAKRMIVAWVGRHP